MGCMICLEADRAPQIFLASSRHLVQGSQFHGEGGAPPSARHIACPVRLARSPSAPVPLDCPPQPRIPTPDLLSPHLCPVLQFTSLESCRSRSRALFRVGHVGGALDLKRYARLPFSNTRPFPVPSRTKRALLMHALPCRGAQSDLCTLGPV